MRQDHVTMLEVSGLRVTLDHRVVLDQVSFTVHRGDILTILGPNGSGKTVLLRALLGLVPCEGVVAWRRGTRLGYVPQRLPYIRHLPVSVADFFALKRREGIDVRRVLQDVGLDGGLATQRMGDLSSGQFQRILIAWALAGEPDVLLFDEPTAGIDIGGEETVYRLLARLHRERDLTMLLVTHDLAVVYELSSTVLCLNKTPICHGAPVEVLTAETLREMYGAEVGYHRHGPG